jgi:23S rRNA (pseudouridine1915-N3)-methyltransferase
MPFGVMMVRLTGKMTLIAVGKLHSAYWRAAQQEYLTRLRRYTDITLIEVKDVVGRGTPDAVAMQREGEALLAAAKDARRMIALTATGKQMESLQLAEFLRKQFEVYGSLAFLIGGPVGLSPEVLAACDDTLSLSLLTFPHELARVVLLEQLYRAATIIGGEKYHK